MSTAPDYAPEAGDTLQQLVSQFSDQYAFIRELIQNSLDAGTKRVDVYFEFEEFGSKTPEGEELGALKLHVDDTGEGMNREIIDTQLTRLFSSSKEGDLTKIGKFGIGFVSVFSLNPEAVVVDTSRDGENWRIFFHGKDKHFDRIVLDHPVDGTNIQIIKMVTRKHYEEIRALVTDRVKYWCKYCDADIFVENRRINEVFGIDHPHAFSHTIPGTEVIVAPADTEPPRYGFYNRGLTLKEDKHEFIPGVQFKIKSRYLEHTLTRDNVLQDENYEKAMGILRGVVDGPFRKRLFEIAAQAGSDEIFGYLVHRLKGLPDELNQKPLVPTVDGQRLSFKQLRTLADKNGELLWDLEESAVTKALKAKGSPVIRWRGPQEEPGLERLLKLLAGKKAQLLKASSTFAQPTLVPDLPKPQADLLEQAGRILKRAGSPYRNIYPGKFKDPSIEDRNYVLQQKPGTLLRLQGEKRSWWTGLFGAGSPQDLVINDRLIEENSRLAQRYPALAPYLLAWAVTLNDGLDEVTATRMIDAALAEHKKG